MIPYAGLNRRILYGGSDMVRDRSAAGTDGKDDAGKAACPLERSGMIRTVLRRKEGQERGEAPAFT